MPIAKPPTGPTIELDLTRHGKDCKLRICGQEPAVRSLVLRADAEDITTLSAEIYITQDSVIRGEAGEVSFEVCGISLSPENRREVYELLKVEFENPEEGLNEQHTVE